MTLIPRPLLFGEPAVQAPSLSPSGTHVAYLAPHGDGVNVWVGALRDRVFRPMTDHSGQPIEEYLWARDERHLLYFADREGAEQHRLMATDLVTGTTRDLTPTGATRATVTGMQRGVPDRVLAELGFDGGGVGLYRLHLPTGQHERVPATDGLGGWASDPRLRVLGAQRREPDGGFSLLVRDDESAPWRRLLTVGYEDAVETQVLGFTGDGRYLVLLSPLDAPATRLLRLDPRTGDVTVLYADPHYDVASASLHPVTGDVDLVVVERARTDVAALSAGTARDLARIRAACQGDITVLGRSHDDRRWLVQDNRDDAPAAYHLFDREVGCDVLFTHQPGLARYRLATVEPFAFTARDGLRIEGYLTFPPGRRHEVPTVVNVHGGPWERNRWGFRAESQWLANRGYLSIEVNYRGSTGFGRAFALAGDREWGGRMQDDLLDAVAWAVARGHADPRRIAIYGSSYGGYAALVGAAFTPDVFRCAVAVAAPVNLLSFVDSVRDYWGPDRARLRRRIGDPRVDADLLWSRSPLSRAGTIRVPLLLAYGGNDPRVPITEAQQLRDALDASGATYQYLHFPDEGHGFARPANVLAFYTAAEEFLARHMGGRCADPAAAEVHA